MGISIHTHNLFRDSSHSRDHLEGSDLGGVGWGGEGRGEVGWGGVV